VICRPDTVRRALSGCVAVVLLLSSVVRPAASSDNRAFTLTRADEAFLEDLERRSFRYFEEQADPTTGQVRDRARTDGSSHDANHRDVASIAATGFGLTGLCIAAERGWLPRRAAADRARTTILFLERRMPHERGWFHHFVNARTGAREWQSEISSIDTALLMAGVLSARRCFADDQELARTAEAVYRRIDFGWMRNGEPGLLSMGWKPESGFLSARWEHYCELMLLYILGIGSPTHALPPASWYAWRRPTVRFEGFAFVGAADPLFVHQYSHAWIDFRGRRESREPHIDWWENSVTATRAHKAFCLTLSTRFPAYTDQIWGITASDGPHGYQAWGGPPAHGPIDGTVVPAAAGGSLMFTPEITLAALKAMKGKYGEKIYGRYGFADAFQPQTGWVNPDVLGIDVGITLLSAENLRSGAVWRWFMANPEIPRALDAVGLKPVAAGVLARWRTESCGGGALALRTLTSDPAVAAPRGQGARP
jgi:hypothetical protein